MENKKEWLEIDEPYHEKSLYYELSNKQKNKERADVINKCL